MRINRRDAKAQRRTAPTCDVILSAVIMLLLSAASHAATAEQMNVLLIVSDDLRDTIGCYGNAAVKTPNIDRLAARGVRFDRAYAQYPVCNPSRVSFLTGMRCEQTRVVNNTTLFREKLPDVVTLPQHLRQNGRYTASYGKIFHTGETRGEVREGWMDTEKSWNEAELFHTAPAGKIIEGRNLTGDKLKWCEWGATAGTDDDQPDGMNALHSIRTIERLTSETKPWFVAAGFHRPHDPFISPKKYFDMYSTGTLKLYRDPADASPLKPLSISDGAFGEAFNAFSDTDKLEFLRAYYAGVSFMDAQVGRLMDTLDRLKLWDNTIIIFIGDHGYHLNERNWWNKNTLFERSCRVPFIVAAPDAKAGTVCRGLIEMVDIYPTIMDYCGLKPPHSLAGKSLRPLLNDPAAPGRDTAFTFVSRGAHYGQAARTDRWRYIQWSDGNVELYDQEKDPEEMHDQSGKPEHSGLLRDMRALLKTRVGDYDSPTTPGGTRARNNRFKTTDTQTKQGRE